MIDTADMITLLRQHLGVDSDDEGFDDNGCLLLLNRAYWAIQNRYNLREKETSYTFNTVQSTKTYTIPALFESIKYIAIEDPFTKAHRQLKRIDPRVFEDEYVNLSGSEAIPEQYYRYNNKINLWPVPNDIYTLTVYHLFTLADLANSPSNYPLTPQEWHELIMMGGIYRGYRLLGNYNKARAAKQDYDNEIEATVPVESKEENDSSTSGLTVKGYDNNCDWGRDW